jgi:hypothetical protein
MGTSANSREPAGWPGIGEQHVVCDGHADTCLRARAGSALTATAWLPISDTGSAAASEAGAALMLATSELLASTGCAELGVERASARSREVGVATEMLMTKAKQVSDDRKRGAGFHLEW